MLKMEKDKFAVVTYSIRDKDIMFSHWSEGLTMIIQKGDITIKLDSDEIQQIVKALPRTIGGKY